MVWRQRCANAAAGLVCLWLAAALPCRAETIIVRQGGSSWTVRALHDVVGYDLTESAGDPTALTLSQVDVDSPLDPSPGALRDGVLWFYRLEEIGRNVVDFYGYSTVHQSSAANALSAPDTGRVFLHLDDTTEVLSLVMVWDAPDDGDGGQATITIEGLPPTAFWAVEDDPGENFTFDPATGIATGQWNWLDCCTDGGAISGIENQDLVLRLTPTWILANGGIITSLEFLSGTGQAIDAYLPITLDHLQPFTIELSSSSAPASHAAVLSVHRNEPLDSPRLAWDDLDRLPRNVDPTSPVRALRECVLADGVTPGVVVVEPRDANGVLLGTGLDVVPMTAGLGSGTLLGGTIDLVDGLYRQAVTANLTSVGFLTFRVEGTPLTSTAVLRFVDTRPEATIEILGGNPFRAGAMGCLRAGVQGGQGLLHYAWDFDGDGVADDQRAMGCFTYAEPGHYGVFLQVWDDQPCYDWEIFPLEVLP